MIFMIILQKLITVYEFTINNSDHYSDKFYEIELEASEPKLVNPVLNTIEVNSLRLGGL